MPSSASKMLFCTMLASLVILPLGRFAPAFGDDSATAESTNQSVMGNAAANSPTVPFMIRSVSASATFVGGACPTQTCTSGASCACETVSGSAIATGIGTATLIANITDNNNACVPTGDTGFECCPADGTMTLTNQGNTISIQLIGSRCVEGGTTAPVVNNMNFTIVPGSGKFSGSFGTGSLQFSIAFPAGRTPTLISGTGVIQIRSGF